MIRAGAAIAALGSTLAAGPAAAWEMSDNRVAAHGDWSVFVESDPTQCFLSTQSIGSRARDASFLLVTFRPEDDVAGEVAAFLGGAGPGLAPSIDFVAKSRTVRFFTDVAWAWPEEADNRQVLDLLSVVPIVALRSPDREERFSTAGFAAAFRDAAERCEAAPQA